MWQWLVSSFSLITTGEEYNYRTYVQYEVLNDYWSIQNSCDFDKQKQQYEKWDTILKMQWLNFSRSD